MAYIVKPINAEMKNAAAQRQKNLAKPFGALGALEDYSARIAGITGKLFPAISAKAVVVFAADNGVWDEGVTPIGRSVTALQSANMTFGKAGIGVLSAHAGAKLYVVDVGIYEKTESRYIINRKVMRGTKNITKGPAMTREQFDKAFGVGEEMAKRCFDDGIVMAGAGEMGVGNTTTSSAVLSALTGLDPSEITGRGAGITREAYENKLNVIRRALEVNKPDASDPADVVARVGGLDIAAMMGFYIRAASLGMVVVIDGFISIIAALAASRLCPNSAQYMFLSHRSAEPGYDAAAKELGLKPMFDLGMRLGEGTGCPLAFNVLEASVRVLRDMATFDEISIDPGQVEDNWDEENQ